MADFTELLQEAEKLTHDIEGKTELPKVERSLKQVLEASNDLYTRVAQTTAKDIQANLLLGSKGIDLPKIVQKLESISTKCTFEPIEPVDDLDISSKLENEIRNRILAAFDTGYNEMVESVYQNSIDHQFAQWKREKRQILSAIGGSSGECVELGKHLSFIMQKPSQRLANLGPIESMYAEKILEYNNSISRGTPKINLVDVFSAIANELKDAKVMDMWEIIKYMVQMPPFPKNEDTAKFRNSKPVIEALVRQGKKYLEDRYKTYMNTIVDKNLSQALRGGVPGTYSLVRSYVSLRFQEDYSGLQDGIIDDRPLWPMVFYCLRSGDLTAAIYCLRRSLLDYPDIIGLLEAKLSNADSSEINKMEETLRFSYRRVIRNDTDPFKRIVWAVLGCCDISDEHTEVAKTADDYLWLKLSLVRVNYGNEDFLKYTDLQHMILEEYGESHYDAFNQPHLYFQVLALTGQFEAAIEFLARIEKFKVHAVHMAIALNELSMLVCPEDNSSPLICIDPVDEKPGRRLNLARLIMLYVRKFELTSINEALQYFFLLRDLTNFNNQNIFKICISDLAVETKEYEKILGKVQRNGIRTKGLIDQFMTLNFSAESIALTIAENLVEKGLLEEAIELYDIANKQDEVIRLMNSMLSRVAHLENEADSLRSRLQVKALVFADRFSREGYRTNNSSVISCFLKLKDLLTFFDQYHAKQYPQALKTLSELQLVPLRKEDLEERVKNFRNLMAEICAVLPDVLLATMNMLFAQYQKIKGNNEYIPRYQDGSMEKQLKHLRDQASCITNFTGMLPYRMPGDTNSRLVQMEILMH